MATIPSGQKFHTVPSSVQTAERGSALANSQREIYTMQDIIDTVPAGAAVNPTSTQMPYNNGGVFADSGIQVLAATSPVPNKSYSISSALTNYGLALSITPFLGNYTFGDAAIGGIAVATGGAAFTSYGFMVMGCGISDPEFGVFNASGSSGLVRMGTQASRSIGVSNASLAMYIGSYFSLFASPTNPTTPVKWVSVVDESSNTYYLPLYQ